MIQTLTPVGVASRSVAEMSGTWWVAQTRPRYEKRLAGELQALGVDCYLPILELIHRKPSGQKVKSALPLFPSYVFVNGDEESRYQAALSDCTSTIIKVVNQGRLARELEAIESALYVSPSLTMHNNLKLGDRCRVTDGPFEGTEGSLIVCDDGRQRFVLIVSMLNSGVELQVSPDQLEKC